MELTQGDLQNKKFRLRLFILVTVVVLIKVSSLNAAFVEDYYSSVVFLGISKVQRALFGWLPFSIGDLFYGFIVILLIIGLVKGIRNIKKHRSRFYKLIPYKKYIIIFLWIYIVFNLLWGVNYNRQGIARQLDLNVQPYTLSDLKFIQNLILFQVNVNKQALIDQQKPIPSNKELFSIARQCYDSAHMYYDFLDYHPPSLKSSLYGRLGNYLGFSGYYNPFSGEAQVNTTIPKILLPYTTCHEMAHQLGYAKEMEANFVGYLTATATSNNFFKYSTYLDLFVYATREVAIYDTIYAKASYQKLLPGVKMDLHEIRNFWLRHQNPVEPVITWLYGNYLKANQQPRGIQAYNEVTADLIAYYKKYRRL